MFGLYTVFWAPYAQIVELCSKWELRTRELNGHVTSFTNTAHVCKAHKFHIRIAPTMCTYGCLVFYLHFVFSFVSYLSPFLLTSLFLSFWYFKICHDTRWFADSGKNWSRDLQSDNGGGMALRNVGFQPLPYTASSPWKPELSHLGGWGEEEGNVVFYGLRLNKGVASPCSVCRNTSH
jgi:hypothetical protein